MLCTNGHTCPDNVSFCPICGTNSFRPSITTHPVFAPRVPVSTTNGLAIASLVLGILWVYWIGSVLALIFGLVARKQIKERGQDGQGMATAGIVLGAIGIATFVIFVIIIITAAHTNNPSY